MQLSGFNYKKAIGEPLTLLLQKTIESKIPVYATLNTKLALSMSTIAQDKESTKGYFHLIGQPYRDNESV